MSDYADLAERLSDLETFRTDALAYIETLQRDLNALKAELRRLAEAAR